jgi:Cof subfamily protein (haloacid dehalogenase superfamily)
MGRLVAEPRDAARGQQLRPALIATDLDGTFLSPDGTVSDLNSAAVLAAQNAGIPVLFATGRPVRWLDVIRDLPGAHPTVIASNGAVLYDLGEGRIVDRICLETEQTLEAVDRIRAAVPDVAFAFESGTRFGYEPTYRTWAADDGTDPAIFTGPVAEIAHAEDFVKLLVQSVSLSADELLDRVRRAVGSSLTATHSQAREIGLVEISAAGVNKASMLQRCCQRLGIDARRVAAFGDMPNDVDMLTWVGMPYAVAGAHQLLHELGFPLVGSNAESGVGQMIMSWLSEASDR